MGIGARWWWQGELFRSVPPSGINTRMLDKIIDDAPSGLQADFAIRLEQLRRDNVAILAEIGQ
jgi:hypothetical protein